MPDKLQELTDKLYSEGLSKGREEGARILEEAREKAAGIVAGAEKQAADIVAGAEKQAADLRAKVESDLRTASDQCLRATKKDIENLLVGGMAAEGVKSALADTGFVKEIISSAAKAFSATEACDLALTLPESLRAELEPWVGGSLAKTLGRGVEASFSKKVGGGFRIGPADGSWFVSLTDETFTELISEYLRPVTRKFLFGE